MRLSLKLPYSDLLPMTLSEFLLSHTLVLCFGQPHYTHYGPRLQSHIPFILQKICLKPQSIDRTFRRWRSSEIRARASLNAWEEIELSLFWDSRYWFLTHWRVGLHRGQPTKGCLRTPLAGVLMFSVFCGVVWSVCLPPSQCLWLFGFICL